MKFSVEHIGLPARDPAAIKDWYIKVLDGVLRLQTDSTPPAYFVQLPGAMLEIYEADFSVKETNDNKLAGFRHLALKVESIENSKQDLESRGVRFPENVKPAGGGGKVLFFQDPEGNLLHMVERSKDSVFF